MIVMIAAVRDMVRRSIFSGGRLAIEAALRHKVLDLRLFDHIGDMIPPRQPGRVEERGGDEERRRDVPLAQDRHGQVEIIAVSIVEG